jgi:molybdate transport system substrate-binding protein
MSHDAARLKVLSARAVHVAVGTLAAELARDTGREADISYAPVGVLQDRLAAGEAADVIILSVAGIDRLQTENAIVAGSRADLGQTAIGLAVSDGAAAPDIATADAFKALLLRVKALALSDPAVGGTAGTYLRDLFVRMGIADAIGAKALPQKSGALVAECVARGEAEIGMTFISEMLPVKGIRVVGPLPAPLGNATAYAAAIMSDCKQVDAARAFIAALVRPERRDVWSAAGFDTPSR